MKTKYIFALILVVLLGMVQKFKGFSLLSPNAAGIAKLDIRTMDYKMYQRSDIDHDSDKVRETRARRPFRVAGVGTFNREEIKPRVRADIKPAVATEKEKDKKKKKKKKKVDLTGTGIRANGETLVYSEKTKPRTASEPEISTSTASVVVGSQVSPQAAQNDKDSKDLAEWKAKLLPRPDKTATVDFIRAYQTNMISDVVFYTLVDLMYAERSADFKSLAILSAGSISSLRSYDFLVKVLTDEVGGSGLAGQSQVELAEYAAINSVLVLRQVLSARLEDETKIEIAVRTLDTSTSYYLAGTAPAKSTQIFSSFITPLENVLKAYATNNEVSAAGERSLQRIKSLTNTVAQNQTGQ